MYKEPLLFLSNISWAFVLSLNTIKVAFKDLKWLLSVVIFWHESTLRVLDLQSGRTWSQDQYSPCISEETQLGSLWEGSAHVDRSISYYICSQFRFFINKTMPLKVENCKSTLLILLESIPWKGMLYQVVYLE